MFVVRGTALKGSVQRFLGNARVGHHHGRVPGGSWVRGGYLSYEKGVFNQCSPGGVLGGLAMPSTWAEINIASPLGFPLPSPSPLCRYWSTRSPSTWGQYQFTSSRMAVGGYFGVLWIYTSPLCMCVCVRVLCGVCSANLKSTTTSPPKDEAHSM